VLPYHSRRETAFDNGFDAFYKKNKCRAGTYTYDGKKWSYSP